MANLKSYLNKMSKEELLAGIGELDRIIPAVHDFYSLRLTSEGEKDVLDKYKRIIKNEFMPERGFGEGRLLVARKAVSDFKKINQKKESLADIMLYYVEIGIEYTNEYGDIDEPFYNSMGSMFESASKFIAENGFLDKFRLTGDSRGRSPNRYNICDKEDIGI